MELVSFKNIGFVSSTKCIPLAPEIEVLGNGNVIIPGNTPSTTDNTQFADTLVISGTDTQTYTISNTGGFTLNVANVVLGGINSGDFTLVGGGPSAVPISAGDTEDFSIVADPSVIGVRSATVTVNSDDADESTYTFNIQITGLGMFSENESNSCILLYRQPQLCRYLEIRRPSPMETLLPAPMTIQFSLDGCRSDVVHSQLLVPLPLATVVQVI